NEECLINITSSQPNVTVDLNIHFATTTDTGNYSCRTDPPDAISPLVYIQITGSHREPENVPTVSGQETAYAQEKLPSHQREGSQSTSSTLTTPSSQKFCSTDQHSSQAGLEGQMWYWMLLGKAAVLLFSLVSLAVKYKRG
ncbi:hypothetical protein AMECASPLE_031037, partial [Ameca splendens]